MTGTADGISLHYSLIP